MLGTRGIFLSWNGSVLAKLQKIRFSQGTDGAEIHQSKCSSTDPAPNAILFLRLGLRSVSTGGCFHCTVQFPEFPFWYHTPSTRCLLTLRPPLARRTCSSPWLSVELPPPLRSISLIRLYVPRLVFGSRHRRKVSFVDSFRLSFFLETGNRQNSHASFGKFHFGHCRRNGQ